MPRPRERKHPIRRFLGRLPDGADCCSVLTVLVVVGSAGSWMWYSTTVA